MAAERRRLEEMSDSSDTPVSQGPPEARYLSVAQVASRLDCSVSLVQKWRRLGWLRAARLGPPEVPVYGYLPEDVDRFAAERWNRRRGRPPRSSKTPDGTSAPRTTAQPSPAAPAPPATTATPEAAVADRPTAASTEMASTAAHTPPPAPSPEPAAPHEPAAPPPENTPTPAPAPPPTPAPAPADTDGLRAPTGRPLVLWDADPREGVAIVLARFGAAEMERAFDVAATWAPRYETLALGEPPPPGAAKTPPLIVALWNNGVRRTYAG